MRKMRMAAVRARTRMARLSALAAVALLACMLAGALSQAAQGEPMWTTYHRDPGRSGNDPDASNPITPTLAWQSLGLGAPIWGQPLVLGSRVYMATVGDKIYALDASSGKVLWEKSAGTPVPSGELPCGDITPTVGIVGTPVIDTSTQVIYAVADTWNASTKEAHHVLKGYSLSAGAEVLSTPVDPPGSDPKALLQRTALNLDAGRVVFGLGGNDGDCSDYRGTVVAAPENGGSPFYWQYQPASPSKSGGAVWGTSGPAVDSEGHIYASTGNPNPPSGKKAETYDYSDSVVRLDSSLSQIGSFKPPTWLQDSNSDADLGSAGPELLPGGLLFQAGKNANGYLIEESAMGSGAEAVYGHQVCAGQRSFGGDAYAGGVIYIPCTNGVQALAYNLTARSFTALWQGPSDANGPPIVSGGLVWSVATAGGKGTKLYGIDPSTGKPRYTETLPSPVADHFASPSAAGGRLFVATGSSVTAYQIARPAPTYAASFGASGETTAGRFAEPEAIAVDSSGNIWVADSGHDRVLEFNAKHEYLRQFGSEGTGEGQFKGIRGIATNAEGDVYVSDYLNNRVQEFSPTGAFLRKFGSLGSAAGQFISPTGIAVDSSGNVWVLNTWGVQVQEFSPTGEHLSGFGSAGLTGSRGITFSGGNLYVSEEVRGRVQEFSTGGTSLGIFDERGAGAGKSSLVAGIATDPTTGNLYVSDVANNNVQEFSPSGSFIAAFGSAGFGNGQFSLPKGVAVGPTGVVYVADTANQRIEEWR